MSARATHYRGRFAPSPTGPLHLGSLIAALASYLDARHNGGAWLVRMDDLDPPREEAGAADRILHSLERHALHWDEDVVWQGQRGAAYEQALQALADRGCLFHCTCTRAQLGPDGACAGRCRGDSPVAGISSALRVRVPDHFTARFDDALQGPQEEALFASHPDFVVKRKDGLYAYQLAVVVDDGAMGITHVVRGSDLMDSTGRQLCLQSLLGLPAPHYAHLPVITTAAGQKFSKQNQAPALDDSRAGCNLRLALRFLGQELPPARREPAAILEFAAARWNPARIPAGLAVAAATIGVKD